MSKRCVAYSDNGCVSLKVKRCPENCAFYRTAAEREEKLAKIFARLRTLPYLKQCDISDKYYGGKMPWA